MDTCCESRTENKSYVRYDLLRFPVLMRPYGWRAEIPALLGRRAYLYANGCGLLSCSGRLIAQLPAWDSLERTAGNCRMDSLQGRRWYAGLCLPGRSASVKEGDQNSGATVLLSDRRPHRGNFQTESAASASLQAFSRDFAPRMAVSVSFPGIGGNYSLKDVGKRYAPPKLPPFLWLSAVFRERP